MDQNSDQIVEQIDRQREELGRDLDELGSRVRRTTDWKAQFDRHPYMFLGAAFGGGLLLSSMVSGGSKTSVNTGVMPYPSYPYSEPDADSYSGYSTARAEDS
ncbi:MAG TPA: DUF3618 domain-containing protein, partial [Bryobacteraceae bacterium]|nr:DUF3618 domain-containing protein [Bryobacteraceae bacterium]